jgi:hypothetical protein
MKGNLKYVSLLIDVSDNNDNGDDDDNCDPDDDGDKRRN